MADSNLRSFHFSKDVEPTYDVVIVPPGSELEELVLHLLVLLKAPQRYGTKRDALELLPSWVRWPRDGSYPHSRLFSFWLIGQGSAFEFSHLRFLILVEDRNIWSEYSITHLDFCNPRLLELTWPVVYASQAVCSPDYQEARKSSRV